MILNCLEVWEVIAVYIRETGMSKFSINNISNFDNDSNKNLHKIAENEKSGAANLKKK